MQPMALSVRAACSAAAVSRSSLYAELKRGRLTARKRGRRTVILSRDLETWLARLPLATVGRRGAAR
jgi:hypothetical protein